jgi:LytS/YehU family sensor histidine kinase
MKRGWWIGVAACFFAAILAELPETVLLALRDAPLGPERLAASILRWTIWGAIFGPLVYRAARRRGIVVMLLAALPVMLLYLASVRLFVASPFDLFQPAIVFTLTAGSGLLAQNRERRIAAERARLDAEQRFSAAQVELLRSELQPHFLFNALNTVSALARRDPATAASIAEKLRDLFRASTRSALPQVTTVEAEVAFTRKYLDIQQARFEERLRSSFTIDPGVETARVPSLLLQPLVENAIRHGMTRREGITLEIQIDRLANDLRLRVINDGIVDDRPIVEGLGLSNTRARLRALYGDAASFVARRRDEGGFAVDVRIPYDGELA